MVVSLNSAPNSTMTLGIVKDAVMNEELRRIEQGIVNEPQALVTQKRESRGRSKSRGPYNRHDRSNDRLESQKNAECFHCKKKGHYIKQCRILKRELDERKGKGKIKDNEE